MILLLDVSKVQKFTCERVVIAATVSGILVPDARGNPSNPPDRQRVKSESSKSSSKLVYSGRVYNRASRQRSILLELAEGGVESEDTGTTFSPAKAVN